MASVRRGHMQNGTSVLAFLSSDSIAHLQTPDSRSSIVPILLPPVVADCLPHSLIHLQKKKRIEKHCCSHGSLEGSLPASEHLLLESKVDEIHSYRNEDTSVGTFSLLQS